MNRLVVIAGGLVVLALTLAIEAADKPKEETVRKEIGKNVIFENTGDKRRVLIPAIICLREGRLEHLLSRTQSEKQHESILTAEFDARDIHLALLATGAKPGKPAQFVKFVNDRMEEDYKPATGDKIKVTLQYEKDGKTVTVPGQKWVLDRKTKKELAIDWVFAGSKFHKDPEGKRPDYYGANEGRVICTSNFTNALLDLPIPASDKDEDLPFEPNTKEIPELGTKVTVILEPMEAAKK